MKIVESQIVLLNRKNFYQLGQSIIYRLLTTYGFKEKVVINFKLRDFDDQTGKIMVCCNEENSINIDLPEEICRDLVIYCNLNKYREREHFFSVEHADKGTLFERLDIWKEEKYRSLQGSYPVIFLSFADVKETSFGSARDKICRIIKSVYDRYSALQDKGPKQKKFPDIFHEISPTMGDSVASYSLKALSEFLADYYGKRVIILLDEYDTPMQEAYVHGYWDEMAAFVRNLFNSTFKTNPYMERAVMTGITRISKESIFSDLNHLEVVTSTSCKYEASFGFTESEVFDAMDEFGLMGKEEVRAWYDGFTFGNMRDIYNPWSIINYLDKQRFAAYWANTSSNSLVEKLIREGIPEVKIVMEDLLQGKSFHASIDEQIIFSQLDYNFHAVWSPCGMVIRPLCWNSRCMIRRMRRRWRIQ